jgi:N-acetylmuramoyl-L-alanine amidase
LQEEKPLEQPKNEPKEEEPKPKEKIGKERLSFFNADKTKIKRVIDTYKHFRTTFEGITIHNNGNPRANARADVNWALNQLPKVSWHYSVDDKEVVRFLAHPDFWNYSCWCSGDGAKGFGNTKTINIEICEFDGYNNPKDPKWLKSRENAIHLIAQLLHDHNWSIDKIGTHKDRSGKQCPRVILKELAQFKKEVNEVLNKLKAR